LQTTDVSTSKNSTLTRSTGKTPLEGILAAIQSFRAIHFFYHRDADFISPRQQMESTTPAHGAGAGEGASEWLFTIED
jgi:hypothetical protein